MDDITTRITTTTANNYSTITVSSSSSSSSSSSIPFDSDHSELYLPEMKTNQLPVIYRREYNINFLDLVDDLHMFNGNQWEVVMNSLDVDSSRIVSPNKALRTDLRLVHTDEYLDDLNKSKDITNIVAEINTMRMGEVKKDAIRERLLDSYRYQTGGSVLAGKLAMERGWAINVGGGFHYASGKNDGMGSSIYADVTLAVRFVLAKYPERVKKVMIVDLDAHQGHGVGSDFSESENVYVLDAYYAHVCPANGNYTRFSAKGRPVQLPHPINDTEYLDTVETNLEASFEEFKPDFVFYVAGSGSNRFGQLLFSNEAVIRRDELVFKKVVREEKIPMAMLMCGRGGEEKENAVYASSIKNLSKNALIDNIFETENDENKEKDGEDKEKEKEKRKDTDDDINQQGQEGKK